MVPAADPAGHLPDGGETADTTGRPPPVAPADPRGPVLVVDDNRDVREYLTRREATWRGALIDAIQDGFYVVELADPGDPTATARVVEVNDAFGAILGYGRAGLPYAAPFPWWPAADDQPTERADLERSLAAGDSGRHVRLARHRDGRDVWIAVAHTRLQDPATGIRVRVGTVRDVTAERAAAARATRLADEQVREADAAFRLLADQADDVVARHHPDGRWAYLSPSAHRAWGYLPDELTGRSPLDYVHPDDHDATRGALRGLAAGPTETLVRMRHRDGEYRWVEVRARRMTDPATGVTEIRSTAHDVHAREVARRQLHAERERYRALVEQVDVGILRTGADGVPTFANDRLAAMLGCPPEELLDDRWLRVLDPVDRERVRRTASAATATRTAWEAEYRVAAPDGDRWVRSTAQPLFAPDGAFQGYLGTSVDVTALHAAEDHRRRTAIAEAAQQVSDAAAARMQSLVSGLAAVVWEADATTLECTFITDRVAELLGYPVDAWLGASGFWWSIMHPGDVERARTHARASIDAGRDYEQTYRIRAADGRMIWLHDVVHLVRDAGGAPQTLQGVMIDVTARRRAERSAALLAEIGQIHARPDPLPDRLAALAVVVARDLGRRAVVSLAGPDGRLSPVAASAVDPSRAGPDPASPDPAGPDPAGPDPASPDPDGPDPGDPVSDDRWASGRPFVAATPSWTALVVPLVEAGRVLGSLVVDAGDRTYDGADLDLAAEIGRRAATLVGGASAATRERQLQDITSALASAETLPEVAEVVARGVEGAFGAAGQSLYVLGRDSGRLRLAHADRYDPEVLRRFGTIGLDEAVPLADAVRTGAPVWLRDAADWAHFPDVARALGSAPEFGGFSLPLLVGGKVVAVLGASFPTDRLWPPDEREFAVAVASAAAQAVQRALDSDQRRDIAETLQRSLLPATPPVLDRLAIATRYLPAVAGVQAGGDWYDVIVLDEHRTAVVVGDVVGQGVPAAAVMGQVRSALTGMLGLLTHQADHHTDATTDAVDPATVLAHLSAHVGHIPGARGSTAICLVVDTRAGTIRWALAGHPPPLLLTGDGGTGNDGRARYPDGGTGPMLGAVRGRPPDGMYTTGEHPLRPGDTVVLYTDGLVERRDSDIDAGMARLAGAARIRAGSEPVRLLTGLLDAMVPEGSGHDDIAVLAARFLPPQLHARYDARPDQLPQIRRDVEVWAARTGLDEDLSYDLLLAVGEATTNAVEHAYTGREPGELTCAVRLSRHEQQDRPGPGPPAAAVEVVVADAGTWRPPPAERGHRGRGLELIASLALDVRIERVLDRPGTTLRFRLPVGGAGPA